MTTKLLSVVPEIISDNGEYLIINKPAGLAVHGGGNLKEPTLADWLIAKYPKIKTVGDDPARPGLVHRLDKDVSGLMVIAKNNKSFANLKNQFKSREINKEYLALVHGRLLKDEDTIDFPIKRSAAGYKMAALPLNSSRLLTRRHPQGRDQGNIDGWFKSRPATTEFTVLKKFVNYAFLRVKIITGRTHQIRVHLSAYGHPLVGDDLYGTKKTKAKNKKLALGRIFLVANHLSFLDLKGKQQDFSLSLPAELEAVLPKH
ncbi:TPA: RluA family pseudouridine synthase [Candidatus Falkowbacteria bacterium]|jgi:23S rRNA pseudouridine1911/1915/1917 synthase|nr:RluA family pseudouridine synthase [Candidatus Falkowbacteria bacterium]